MKLKQPFFLSCLLVLASCTNETAISTQLKAVNAEMQQQFAPDKRVAIYDIQIVLNSKKITLTGETTAKKALQQLIDSIKKHRLSLVNKVRIIPDSAVGKNIAALGKNSVINIRSKPSHSAELATQGLLGMPLKVLDKKGDFYRVQTPDNYIAWVDRGGIQLMTTEALDNWNSKQKIIFTANMGYAFTNTAKHATQVSDLVFGDILAFIKEEKGFYEVQYPDGRTGFVQKNEADFYDSWLKKTMASSENIETAAKTFVGSPYLWGGTSTKGTDCSGFTKMVYLMNGFVIPRDASQQIKAGKTVDKDLQFEGLQKGDLLFFGIKATESSKQRVSHVGIWLGNGKEEFIHSSGNVHISSMNKEQPNYDAFNKNRYLGSKRYLGIKDHLIVDLKEANHIKP